MQYSNYDMKNNVHATLSTAISSVATTIQLTAGQGARFGNTFPQIATLESFDENGKVIKREIVQITGRSGDNLTVVRAFAPCPENDDANSQSQNAISFNADDTISLYIPKEIFDIIKKSLNDIYDNGANNMRTEVVSGLQVEVNPGQVLVGSAYYDFAGGTITLTDNATNYLEIDEDGLLANNTSGRNDENTKLAIITTSGGSVTNIKDRRLGTVGGKIGGVNIHELTEKINLVSDDEFIIADSENIYQNKRIKYSNAIKINSLTEKSATVDNDILLVGDSENSFEGKKVKIQTIKDETIAIAPRSVWINTTDGLAYNTFNLGLSPYFYYRNNSTPNMYKHSPIIGTYAREVIAPSSVAGNSQFAYCDGIAVYKNYVYACIYGYVSGTYKRTIWKQSIYGDWTDTTQRQEVLTVNYTHNGTPKFLGFDGTYFILWDGSKLICFDLNGNVTTKNFTSNIGMMNENGNLVFLIERNSNRFLQVYDNYTNMNLLKEFWLCNTTLGVATFRLGMKGDIIYTSGVNINSAFTVMVPSFYIK